MPRKNKNNKNNKKVSNKKSKNVEPEIDIAKQEYDINIKCIKLIEIVRKSKKAEDINKAFESLIVILMPKIQKVISKFNIPGCDNSDILQEALYALRYKAVKDYDKERGTGDGPAFFDKFALLCIRRHLATEFKSSYQNKRRVLNHSISIDKESNSTNKNDEDMTLAGILADPNMTDVMTSVGEAEYYRNLQNTLLGSLSGFEKEVYILYAQKFSYEEIAEKINNKRSKIRVNIKGIDNALSRIKHKAHGILLKYEKDENSKVKD
jgi:RNA polymerase sigma factor (sigma-70 family)